MTVEFRLNPERVGQYFDAFVVFSMVLGLTLYYLSLDFQLVKLEVQSHTSRKTLKLSGGVRK